MPYTRRMAKLIAGIARALMRRHREPRCPLCRQPAKVDGFCTVAHAVEWQDSMAW